MDSVSSDTRASVAEIEDIARRLRGRLVEMSHHGGAPHLGSSLSCIDIVVSAYWGILSIDPERPDDPNRDRFILSKGHAATALYASLATRGFFPESTLNEFNRDGSRLAEHPSPGSLPGIEAATGSLGHGLPIGVGMALAGKIQGRNFRVFALLSDGECNEGSTWEAAQAAPAKGLDNICVIVDHNKWQATARTSEALDLGDLRGKWEAFGWKAVEVDGHNIGSLLAAMREVPEPGGKPVAIVAHTVKGKGISFMEDDNNWHYRIPTEDEIQDAHRELGLV